MHARPVVVFGDLVEAEREVVVRSDPLGRIDRPRLERCEQLAARQVDDRHAELLQRFPAEAGYAHLHALDAVGVGDFLVEPAAHLDAGATRVETLEAEWIQDLIPEFLAAAVVHPGGRLRAGQSERHRGKELERLALVRPVVWRGVHQVGGAARDSVEALEGRHQFAGGEHFDRKAAVGRRGDAFSEAVGAGAQAWKILRPRRDHLPFGFALGNRRSGERRRSRGRAGERRALEKLPTFQKLLLLSHWQHPPMRARYRSGNWKGSLVGLQPNGKPNSGDAGAQQVVHVNKPDRLAALDHEQRRDPRLVKDIQRG